jgi:hypothetical protein
MPKVIFHLGNSRKSSLLITVGLVVLALTSGRLLAQESQMQLFLSPAAVPEQIYTTTEISPGGSVIFNASQVAGATTINDVAVMGELLPNPNNPSDGSYTPAQLSAITFSNESTYFAENPGVSYSASNPGGATDTVTFSQPGQYFVQLQTNNGNGLFEVNAGDDLALDGAPQPAAPNRLITAPPNNNTTIIANNDPPNNTAMANARTQLPNAQVAGSVADVVNDIMNVYNNNGHMKFEVSLVGHGREGSINFGGQRINDQGDQNGGMTVAQFQAAIDQYCSSVHLFGCDCAGGPQGAAMLQTLGSSIGLATGYTDDVTISTTYFDTTATSQFLSAVPEPSTIGVLTFGCAAILARRRRRAHA